MGLNLLSLLLGLLPLLGIGYILYSGWIKTVDGLFMSLILLTLSGVFFFDIFLDLRKRGLVPLPRWAQASPEASPGAAAGAALRTRLVVASGPSLDGARRISGVVEEVEFYESPVGVANKTLVLLRDSPGSVRMLAFAGDTRPKLLVGRRATLTYRSEDKDLLLLGVEG